MAVSFPSFRQTADRLQQIAGQVAGHLIAARQRPGSAALLVRLNQRARRFHALAIDERAAEIAERARCGPVDLTLPPAPPATRRLAQRGAARHAGKGFGQRRALCRGYWLLLLLLGCGLVGGALWAGAVGVSFPPAPAARLVACTKPTQAADPGVPCPHPLPGGSSTTQLGTCPSASSTPGSGIDTQMDSCTELSIVANTYAFYGVIAFGFLCLLWWLSTVVKALSLTGGSAAPEALGQVGKQFLLACFAFLVAWSVQVCFGQLEAILLTAQHDATAVPFHTFVFLAEVALILLVRLGFGLALLLLLLKVLGGLGAVAESSPRALAVTARDLRGIIALLLILAFGPWFLSLGAQWLTSRS